MTDGRLERRLEVLQQELQIGTSKLMEIDVQRAQLHETLLRIDGAIHLVQELLQEDGAVPASV
jgi:hypothetical protein